MLVSTCRFLTSLTTCLVSPWRSPELLRGRTSVSLLQPGISLNVPICTTLRRRERRCRGYRESDFTSYDIVRKVLESTDLGLGIRLPSRRIRGAWVSPRSHAPTSGIEFALRRRINQLIPVVETVI